MSPWKLIKSPKYFVTSPMGRDARDWGQGVHIVAVRFVVGAQAPPLFLATAEGG